jgi:hypothetical protein
MELDLLEALDHNVEDLDFEPMGTEPVTCTACGGLLNDEDLLRGATHLECVPVEWVSGRLRHGYRRPL